jgi:hypothetical protein
MYLDTHPQTLTVFRAFLLPRNNSKKFPFANVIFSLVTDTKFGIVVLCRIPIVQVKDLKENKISNQSLSGLQARKVLEIHSIISMLGTWKDDKQ